MEMSKTERHDELKRQYALDEILHPEGRPWEWWEVRTNRSQEWWVFDSPPHWSLDSNYRRKSTAPDWGLRLSIKEVQECDEWPEGYRYNHAEKTISHTIGHIAWCSRVGFIGNRKDRINLLAHFQKRREAALSKVSTAQVELEQIPQYREFVEFCERRKGEMEQVADLELMVKNQTEFFQNVSAEYGDLINDKNESIDYLEVENDKLEAVLHRVQGELEAKDLLLQQIGDPPQELKDLKEKFRILQNSNQLMIEVLQGIRDVCVLFRSEILNSKRMVEHLESQHLIENQVRTRVVMEMVLEPLQKHLKKLDPPQQGGTA
jgi:hypothetical protein